MAVPNSAQREAAEATPPPSARVFLTGSQALVRVLLEQAQRDAAAGLRTAGYASGYRGSPLGGLDQAFARAAGALAAHRIEFQPGLNEELAATALWGTQQVGLFDGARQDGVFGLWYGKGPGVDRAGDAFKHANLAGTAPLGGVLAVAGDDHAAASSTTAHQSEFALADAMMPVLVPATVQEILDLGLAGIALSRFAGCWTALKLAADIAEGAATVRIDRAVAWRAPADFTPPADGLHIRWPDRADAQEARLIGPKMQAAQAFARANGVDRLVVDTPAATRGIVAAGKAWSDLVQALADLGLDTARCEALGLRLYKVALVWPLEPQGARRFAAGLDEVLVVEEKRPLIESQLRDLLYDLPDAQRPRVLGKRGRENQPLLPASGELTPHRIAGVVARWLGLPDWADGAGAPADRATTPAAQRREKPLLRRQPHFCSGCPHSRATRTPEGSRALAGIGCHTMALWTDPATKTLTQMGGEGATWIGQAPFTDTPHVFQNIGDGTFAHSGLLAIRAAVAAGVNITYRLLFNDAVAMTGGQPVEGALTVPRIARILEAEGVARIIVAAEEPERYPASEAFPRGVTVTGRDALDCAQRELREVPGVTVLIFDQTCAAEKRRRRGRGDMAPPARYAFINEAVCENCGDCVTASNCLSVVPVETEFGRKRRIDQASCNADLSCVDGFCPSFVTVEHARLRKKPARALAESPGPLPAAPELPPLDRPFAILIAGIGGTGVVTLGRILGRAAEIAGQAIAVTDQTGLAQKGGAVLCHLRIAATPAQIGAARIGPARDGIDGADVILGCDLVVAAGGDVLARVKPGAAKAIVNSAEAITGSFLRQPDTQFPSVGLQEAIRHRLGAGAGFIDAAGAAARLTGQSATANVLLLGYAWQKGLIPLAADAIHGAIGTVFQARGEAAVTNNRAAFDWGRRLAADGVEFDRVIGHGGSLGESAGGAHRRACQPSRDGVDRLSERGTGGTLSRVRRPGARGQFGAGAVAPESERGSGGELFQAARRQRRV